MTQPIDIPIDFDVSGTQQVSEAADQVDQLQTALQGVTVGAGGVQRALNYVTPNRAMIAAWAGAGTAAAFYQQQLTGLDAKARVTGQSQGQLSAGVRQLARDFPVGISGAVQATQAVQALGLSTQRQIPQIRALSREVVQLGGATGESIPALATNFGQLNRQLASLDPSRFGRFADVLTTVSAKSGASALGIVNFAQSIAPMAQQAGLGESAVLGISGAFAKLGDDGYSAGTAVNKILTDINASVREGSNQLTSYSQLVGMTSTQFRKLYQANPAEALTRVTNAIAQAGPQGQYQLQNLGLDGVRSQRALLELSNSGGLGASINQAVTAYGNGSTAAGAATAFGSLNDSLTKLRSTTGEVADSLGAPLLHPLTQATNLLSALARPLVAIAGSGPSQRLLGALAYAGAGAFLLRRAVRPLGTAALAVQAATSGPVRGLASGYALGRYGEAEAMAATGRAARFGAPITEAYLTGQRLGRGPMDYINRAALSMGRNFGETRADLGTVGASYRDAGSAGRSLLYRATRLPIQAASLGAEAWARFFSDPFHQTRMSAVDRSTLLAPAAGGAFSRFGTSFMGGLRGNDVQGMSKAWRDLQTELGGTGTSLRRFAESIGVAARESYGFAARGVERFGGGALRGAGRAALGFLGGPVGLGLTAGVVGYEMYQSSRNRISNLNASIANQDIYGSLNQYRDAMGKAGEASVTLADQMEMAASTITRSITSFGQAQQVTNADYTAAGAATQQRTYVGSNSQIAAQISALGTGGVLTPSDLQGAKYDLIKQNLPEAQINQILGMVQTSSGAALSPDLLSNLVGGIAAGSYSAGRGGFGLNYIKRSATPNMWKSFGHFGTGSPVLGKGGDVLNLLNQAIGQQFQHQQQTGGLRYAASQEVKAGQRALSDALSTGDADTVVATEQNLTSLLTGKAITGKSAADIQSAGGLRGLLGDRTIHGYSASSLFGRVRPTMTTSGDFAALSNTSAMSLLPFYVNQSGNNRSSNPAGAQAVTASINSPEDLAKQTRAVNAIVEGATKAGTSLNSLATQSARAMGQFGPNTTEYAQMQGVIQRIQFLQAGHEQQLTMGQSFGYQTRAALGLAHTNINDPNAQQLRQQGQQQLQSVRGQEIQYMQSRILAQRQFDINSARENEDYQRTLLRQDQDYSLQRVRATQDYQLQVTRSQEDFQLQRRRSLQDYNIQLSREVQSAAQTMYDPYTRIAAKPVFDATNLVGNIREQNQALATQERNVQALRRSGLNMAVIRTLDLTNTNNAQQTQQILDDVTSDPTLINQLNAQIARRLRNSKGLFTDPGNTSFAQQRQDLKLSLTRSRQDFNTAQERASQDFHTQMARDAQDFATQVARQRQDFNLELSRQRQDLHEQDQQITGNMKTLQKDMIKILHGQQVDWQHTLVTGMKQTLHTITHYSGKITDSMNSATSAASSGGGGSMNLNTGGVPGGGSAVGNAPITTPGRTVTGAGGQRHSTTQSGYVRPGTGRVGDVAGYSQGEEPPESYQKTHPPNVAFNKSIARTMMKKYGWGDAEFSALDWIWGGHESGWSQYAHNYSDPNNYGQGAYGIPQSYPGHKMAMFGADWRTNPATQIAWGLKYIKDAYGDPINAKAHYHTGYATGGIALKPHIGMVAEAGSPEAMIPLDYRGVKMLAAAMRQYMGDADAKFLVAGGRSHEVHIDNSRHIYDNRVHMPHAKIDVVADDPIEFGRKLDAKARRDNLASTNPVRSG